jgi:nucleoside-diphosphate-sugar epimerase
MNIRVIGEIAVPEHAAISSLLDASFFGNGRTTENAGPDAVLLFVGNNIETFRDALETSVDPATQLIVCSSYKIYRAYSIWANEADGENELVPILEDDPLDQKGLFFAAETLVRQKSTLPFTILRLPEIYGPGLPNTEIRRYLMDIERTNELSIPKLQSEWRLSRCYIKDVCNAIALVATKNTPARRTFNVADSVTLALTDWVRAISRAAQWNGTITVVNDTASGNKANYDQHLIVDSTRIRQDLGYGDGSPIHKTLSETVTSITNQKVQMPGEVLLKK